MVQVLTKNGRVGMMGALLALTLALASCGTQNPLPAGAAEQPVETAQLEPQLLTAGDNNLSVEPFVKVSNGWGPVERDRSNGEQAAGDGRTLTLNGKTYSRGFGTHAGSSLTFDLGGRCQTFTADVGVDDEVGRKGSVVFQVYADGVQVYNSGRMTGQSTTKTLSVPVAGAKELRLVVTDGGDGISSDHADWVNPTLLSCTPPPSVASVSVAPSTLSLLVGGTAQFTASVDARAGANPGSTWSSSAPGIATVDATGKVTAVAPGTATITVVSSFDTAKKASGAVTVTAPPPPAPAQVAYSGPITITKGGTYSGNWESPTGVPVVSIQTSEPVIIENSRLRGIGRLIDGWHYDLTVRNVRGDSLTPNVAGKSATRVIAGQEIRNLRVENSSFSGGGIYIRKFLGSGDQGIRILRNTFSNIDGRKSDGAGGFSGKNLMQAVQFDDVTSIRNAEIAWNQMVNEPGKSAVEDVINFWQSSGAPDAPILVHDNYIQGAYPPNPATDTDYSGGGIMIGDGKVTDPLANGYFRVWNNVVVATTNYGISLMGGVGSEVFGNRVVSSGRLPDGRRIPTANVGLSAWDIWNAGALTPPTYAKNVWRDNVSGFTKVRVDGTTENNHMWMPHCTLNGGTCTNNTGLGTQTLASEAAEWTRWQQKLSGAGVRVGAQ